jgi:predicted nucleotidyltransferase
MLDRLRRALEAEADVAYALVFGSAARGPLRPDSDVDVAVQLHGDAARDLAVLGALVARLESAVGRTVDLVLLDAAPPPLAYRAFRDGHLLVARDPAALSARKARAVLDYLDFKPVEERCTAGVLRAARARGR